MDHPPLNRDPAPGSKGGLPQAAAPAAYPGISTGIAAAGEHGPAPIFSRSRNNEAARSLAEIAARDLDAALQLLAERAQYITDASGAAIALRRGEHHDMLCRASAGSNAPELGAILSMRYGLSGESVRTGQMQRCDDAQNDPRVNREACLQLGIASVIVMPILSGEQAFGVFELFSGKPFAFAERDVSALQRLSTMVELAVKFAVTAEAAPPAAVPEAEEAGEETAAQPVISAQRVHDEIAESAMQQTAPLLPASGNLETSAPKDSEKQAAGNVARNVAIWRSSPRVETPIAGVTPDAHPAANAAARESAVSNSAVSNSAVANSAVSNSKETDEKENFSRQRENILVNDDSESAVAEPPKSPAEAVARKPLFWTAPVAEPSEGGGVNASSNAPPTLRNLQKCQACGFPVSQGRLLCVECEEKKWRGQPLPRKSAIAVPERVGKPAADLKSAAAPAHRKQETSLEEAAETKPGSDLSPPADVSARAEISVVAAFSEARNPAPDSATAAFPAASTINSPAPFLASSVESQSWLAANKYVLIALLMVAAVIAAVAFLR